MGKKKTETKSTVDYTQIAPKDTPDTIAARAAIQNVDYTSPVLGAYGQIEKNIDEAQLDTDLDNKSKERTKYARMFETQQHKGRDLANAKAAEHQFKTGQQMNLAALTQNRILQSGGTQVQTQSQPWGSYLMQGIGSGAQVASAGLMSPAKG